MQRYRAALEELSIRGLRADLNPTTTFYPGTGIERGPGNGTWPEYLAALDQNLREFARQTLAGSN